jgi:recombinational DNA repair protein (RecF pathway)
MVRGKCDICGKEAELRRCLVCGREVCPSHYYVLLGVCSKCIKKD